ncbi:hypothetical protein MMF93_20010 [Streptomyces tubbatahanensis]|uniref:TPM domain-containing protein n=1 Tax=Streptomyces tubbatahanensis TaxID=2923272 RepID=A0ABY3XVU8_9ACTN|nr:hypothetical protein [Streptomyces tubbatahanensis]UNS98484.1 hypothetical protein MMF93_20010 [Streptomyces tubbatahanensis]
MGLGGLGGLAGAGGAHAAERHETPAAYLAEQLKKSPVFLSDQMPRSTPRSAKPAFVKEAGRTGVPTYVAVVPASARFGDEGLLEAVHDRVGRRGLYVLLSGDGGSPRAAAFGVDVQAREAAMATTFELPYDAGALDAFRHFVDVIRSGDAAARADSGASQSRAGEEPGSRYTSPSDRDNQSFLTGLLLVGVPVVWVGAGWYVRRWRQGKGARPPLVGAVLPAVVSAVVIGVGAPLLWDDTRTDGDPLPTAADMAARTDRVAEALRDDPVYVDPFASGLLTRGQRAGLEAHAQRLERRGVPVRVVVVPLSPEDESAGDGEVFARRLHQRLGTAGDGVYVVAPPSETGGLDLVNYGAKVASRQLHVSTEQLRYGEDTAAGDGLYGRLYAALRAVGRAPSGSSEGPYLEPPAAPDPVEEDALPGLYSGDFSGGAVLGAVAGPLALGLTAGGLGLARRTGLGWAAPVTGGRGAGRTGTANRSGPGGPGTRAPGGGPPPGEVPHAPARPSTGWLRRTARRELDALSAEFERLSEQLDDRVRTRAWGCLDAATLLLDQQGDSRVDADADAPTLAAGLALVRAGHAAVRDRELPFPAELRLCLLNPLHGPASATRRLELPGEGSARARPVCSACAAALAARDSASEVQSAVHIAQTVGARLLCLRTSGSGRLAAREPYHRVPGPLGARGGTGRGASLTADQIVRRVREQLGVH